MNWLQKACVRARALFDRPAIKREIDEELASHLEQCVADNIAGGLSREEAVREARKRFGNLLRIREDCRDMRGASFGETWLQDMRFGLRMLRKNLGFTTVVVVTLALGIGACTAIFSVVNAVLLRPLPYEHSERLVQLWEDPSGKGQDKNSVAAAQFADWKEQTRTMEHISVIRRTSMNLTGVERPERLNVHKVSSSYLQILGIRPSLGRDFLPDEDQPGAKNVVLLTHQLWQRQFGAERELTGREIRLSGESYTVIGILPSAPELPFDCDAIVPFVFGSEEWHRSRGDHRVRVIGRLQPGTTIEQARSEMAAITGRLKPSYPSWKQDWGVTIVLMHEEITGAVGPQLWILFGAVGFLLMIACANVAGLLLARMTARRPEMAVRLALGAGRRRVIQQLMTESVLLSVLGGALGVGLALLSIHLFRASGAEILPRVREIGLDHSALGFALATSLLTGILFGLAPALHLIWRDLTRGLKQQGRTVEAGGGRARAALIVLEVALAVVLLAGAGLLAQTLLRLQAVSAGFNPHNLLAMDVSFDDNRYPSGDRRAVFLRDIFRRIESLPGVECAGATTTLPMAGSTDSSVRAERHPDQDRFYIGADYDFVAGNFHRAMGMSLLRGRALTERDDSTTSPRVALLNEALASKAFGSEDPLGERVRFHGEFWEVVGVVGNVRNRGLDREAREHIYLPQAFSGFPCSLVVRTKVEPLALSEIIRGEILKLDPDQPVSNARTLEQIMANAAGQRRLMLGVLGLFATAAVSLAAIGLYGVMAYAVSRRAREIGIRMALGAQRRGVVVLVMKRGLKMTLLGVGSGLIGALALTHVLTHVLFGITPRDPVTLGVVAVLLVAVALLACWLPARRATRIDPMKALRCE